jgi:hypothetical protein
LNLNNIPSKSQDWAANMIDDRATAINTISRVLAITKLDIEHHQAINDLSLNIHAENYFRDVFNFIFNRNFKNANDENANEPYIDLVDHDKKEFIQITTTRTKDKILNTLKIFNRSKYKDYKIYIFFLFDKASPSQKVIDEINDIHPEVDLKKALRDSSDLIRKIEKLETNKLIELSKKYFAPHTEKYTDEIVLNLICKKLLTDHNKLLFQYDSDLGSIFVEEKLKLNKIVPRVAHDINTYLDYTSILDSIQDENIRINLRELVINDLYRNILIEELKSKENKKELKEKDISEIHNLAIQYELNFSRIIFTLKSSISELITIKDFNNMNISWIIVAYFFEACDIGVHLK